VEKAALDIQNYDEDRVLLDSAVKASDGFFTTFFVSTWSRYVARAAARAGLSPNQVTVIALCIGLLAATAFATGERAGYIAGAVLLYLSFVADCVDGQLARYTRRFSKFGAWLDSVFDRAKEYAAFAGLGIGAGTDEVWILAGAAITLQSLRHSFDFSYGATDRQAIAETPQPPVEQSPDATAARSRMNSRGTLEAKTGTLLSQPPPAVVEQAVADDDNEPENGEDKADKPARGRRPLARRVLGSWRVLDRYIPGLVWVKKMLAFPIGERFAVICVTAAIWGPRTSFIVLLSWGGFALVYTSAGRVLRSILQWRALPR
jgi:phosphatidylglycerophosphate synthase